MLSSSALVDRVHPFIPADKALLTDCLFGETYHDNIRWCVCTCALRQYQEIISGRQEGGVSLIILVAYQQCAWVGVERIGEE